MSRSVLIADDENSTVDLLKKTLGKLGYDVTACYDGLQAMESLKDEIFDVVLLDYNMPGLSGTELIRFAKERDPSTKVIIFTGYTDMDEKMAIDCGADEFLQKPLTLEAIEKALR
ncbi:response regulator [Candidatus Omnitrophota bacterium]